MILDAHQTVDYEAKSIEEAIFTRDVPEVSKRLEILLDITARHNHPNEVNKLVSLYVQWSLQGDDVAGRRLYNEMESIIADHSLVLDNRCQFEQYDPDKLPGYHSSQG
jgi:hypothetical protein